MLLFAILAVFIAGLMVGRTPEYLGKKIEQKEVKMAMLAAGAGLPAFWVSPARWRGDSLRRTIAMESARPGHANLATTAPHGLSEMLYAYTSAVGTTAAPSPASTPTRPGTTPPSDRHADRPLPDDDSAAGRRRQPGAKKQVPVSAGTFPTHGPLFVGLLVGVW
jgi:potassium-transporting ATPase potassium-binding subunit